MKNWKLLKKLFPDSCQPTCSRLIQRRDKGRAGDGGTHGESNEDKTKERGERVYQEVGDG